MSALLPLTDYTVYLIVAVPAGDAVEQATILEWYPHEALDLPLDGPAPGDNHVTNLPTRTGLYACRATLYVERLRAHPAQAQDEEGLLPIEHLLELLPSLQRELRIVERRPLWLPNGARLVHALNLMEEIPFSVAWPPRSVTSS